MKATKLHIGRTTGKQRFLLPIEAATQTFSIIAKRGVGKTYTAAVMCEELLSAGVQTVVLDPLDVCWGLRSSADGSKSGLPIVILGGSHGDLPLSVSDGEVIADLVVEQGISVILSTRHLRKGEQRQFVTAFAERLYHRKGEPQHRQPLHLVIDEADSFAPQRVFSGQERMVGAIDDLVRRGRASGIGVTLITQRAAAINKDVLTQSEVLIALRTISPQDRKAVEAWIEAHDAHGQRKEFMASLASLPVGTAWFWSPGWLDVFEKVEVRKRQTFDSSATPKAGSKLKAPKKVAVIDLKALRTKLQTTVEKAKENDPKELRRRIRDLEKANKTKAHAVHSTAHSAVDNKAIERAVAQAVARTERQAQKTLTDLKARLVKISKTAERMLDLATVDGQLLIFERPAAHHTNPAPIAKPTSKQATPTGNYRELPGTIDNGNLGRCERAILAVLAQQGICAKTRVAILSGYSHKSGGFNNSLGSLRSKSLIQGTGAALEITHQGLARLGDYEPMPTGSALVDFWMHHKALGRAERRILQVLVDAFPGALTKEEVARQTDYSHISGGFNNALSRLRTLLLIDARGAPRASEELF